MVLSRERYPAYSPTALPHFIMGHLEEKNLFRDARVFHAPSSVRFVLGKEVVGIEPGSAKIIFDDGEELPFDELLLATGATPVVPPIEGLHDETCLVLRTLDDAKKLMRSARRGEKAVILGAGFVGMQCAVALRGMGLQTTVIEKEDRVLPAYLGRETAGMIREAYEANGVRFRLGATAVEIGSRRTRIVLADGEQLEADVLLVATGVRPRTSLLGEDSGIRTSPGILVDEFMQTNCPHVFAAGDVAQAPDFFTGKPVLNPIMLSAAEQGRVAGLSMIGISERYAGTLTANVLSYFGHIAFTIGSVHEAQKRDERHVGRAPNHRGYHSLVFSEDRLVGAQAIDTKVDPGLLYSLIRNKIVLTQRDRDELGTRPLEKSHSLVVRLEKEARQI